MKRRELLKSLGLGTALSSGLAPVLSSAAKKRKYNVVMIVCDDLNDYIAGFNGHPQARTPHVAKLAKSSVSFRHAYSNNPVCAPSRSSFLTGIYCHTSGNLFWGKWYDNPVLKNSKTIMEHFKDNGYHVAGTGKLMHHHKKSVWSEYKYKADYGPFWYDGKERTAHPRVPKPFYDIGPVDGSFGSMDNIPGTDERGKKEGWIYGSWGMTRSLRYKSDTDRSPTPDEKNAKWAVSRIEKFSQNPDKPFFLGVGFIRPHTPLIVPKKYFDMFPLDKVKLPVIKKDDAKDTYFKDVIDSDQKGLRYYRVLGESYPTIEEGLRAFTQAYLASVAAVDDCIGEILTALDKSPLRDNTIVLLTSDHGWNMGEKNYLFKNSLWEESARVPMIIRAPGISKQGKIAEAPVSLIDIYPTLNDLCGLKGDTRKNEEGAPLDGYSMKPFLEDPENGKWDGPDAALTMVFAGGGGKGNLTGDDQFDHNKQQWSVRTKNYRYILYNTGQEELYDHTKDEYEWDNRAKNPEYKSIKHELNKKLKELIRIKEKTPYVGPQND